MCTSSVKTWTRKRPAYEYGFYILSIVAVILTIALIYFIVKASSSNGGIEDENQSHDHDETSTLIPEEVYDPKYCLIKVENMIDNLNLSFNSCDNFYKYTCDYFNEKSTDDKHLVDEYSLLQEKISKQLNELILSISSKTDLKASKKLKFLYDSCIKQGEVDLKNNKMTQLIEQTGGWPVVDGIKWSEERFDITKFIVETIENQVKFDSLFIVSVDRDFRNPDKFIITIDEPDMQKGRSFVGTGKDRRVPYFDLMVESAQRFGAPMNGKTIDEMQSVLTLEIELTKLFLSVDKRKNPDIVRNVIKLKDLQEKITKKIDLTKILRSLFGKEMINSETEILVPSVNYLENMSKMVDSVQEMVLANYVTWRMVYKNMRYLSPGWLDFEIKTHGKLKAKERWDFCVDTLRPGFDVALSSLYVKKNLRRANVEKAREVYDQLVSTLKEQIKNVKWLNSTTINLAIEKIDKTKAVIGFKESILNDQDVDDYYSNLNVFGEDFFDNILQFQSWFQQKIFSRLQQIDKFSEKLKPIDIETKYDEIEKTIVVPLGGIQPPFFDYRCPSFFNLGRLGTDIAHELFHVVDSMPNMYTSIDFVTLLQRNPQLAEIVTKFKKQYSEFKIDGLQINAERTLRDNIADQVGLEIAYKVFSKNMTFDFEEELPQFTAEQLFFMSFSTGWCSKDGNSDIIRTVLNSNKAPSIFRVNGPIQNSPDFPRAFNCSMNSYMNPTEKSSILT